MVLGHLSFAFLELVLLKLCGDAVFPRKLRLFLWLFLRSLLMKSAASIAYIIVFNNSCIVGLYILHSRRYFQFDHIFFHASFLLIAISTTFTVKIFAVKALTGTKRDVTRALLAVHCCEGGKAYGSIRVVVVAFLWQSKVYHRRLD